MMNFLVREEITPLVSIEEMLAGFSLAWMLGYLVLLSPCGFVVYSKLRRDHLLVRRYFFSQLGWAFLLTAFLPRLFPLIWPPVVLSWLLLAFLLLIDVSMLQGRKHLHRGLSVNSSRRGRAQQKGLGEQTSSPHGSSVHFQQRETDGDA